MLIKRNCARAFLDDGANLRQASRSAEPTANLITILDHAPHRSAPFDIADDSSRRRAERQLEMRVLRKRTARASV
jgi:hypothetical protein